MLSQLGHGTSAASVARLYSDFVDVFVLDRSDAALKSEIEGLGIKVQLAATLMDSEAARARLALTVMEIFR